ncbi:MAG: prepilin-type N-terminal cleavage/methylation domain-containing protein [Thermoanaerobaculia bacterium]
MRYRTDFRRSSRGFSLVESLVTLFIVSVLMVGLFTLLDQAGTLSKQETNVADAQSSSRSALYEVAKIVREARIGQLYYGNAVLPYFDNATAGKTLTDAAGTAHPIREGTDSIEVRGAFYSNPYSFTPSNITCGGVGCDPSNSNVMQIRIDQVSNPTPISTVTNYPAGGLPAIASRTKPFYFVVASTSLQGVTIGSNSYLVPLYYVGRVNANAAGTWYTSDTSTTPASFTFLMDATDANAKKLLASATPPPMQNPYSGAIVDDVIFFVDNGTVELNPDGSATTKFMHPYLAQAILDPSTGNYDIQPIAEDVEDFQVAYGVDGLVTGSAHDRGVSPSNTAIDVTAANKDEWSLNQSDELLTDLVPKTVPARYESFIDGSIPSSNPNRPEIATAALKSVLLAIVVKSNQPELRFSGPGYDGIKVLNNVTAKTSITQTVSPSRPYRRRLLKLAVSLRNYL